MSVDEQILYALRQSTGDPVSGAELAQRLGVSRAAIWSRIEDLRKLGYGIEAKPHQGYRLVSTPDAVYADDIMARLSADRIVGRDIRVFKSTSSTNDIVEKLAIDGAGEGVVVFVVIPTTILLTLFASNLMGYTINRVSLFALIFSIGILVDDAIVVIENIARHWAMRDGRSRVQAAIEAVAEV